MTAAALVIFSSCGGKKEWETKADAYCDCLTKAKESKESDPNGFVEKFKACQDMTTQHQEEITDKDEAFDYRKKVNACIDEAYK